MVWFSDNFPQHRHPYATPHLALSDRQRIIFRMRYPRVIAASIFAVPLIAVVIPANPALAYESCVISVPNRVVLQTGKATDLTATILSCPAGVFTRDNSVSWTWNKTSTNDQGLWFSRYNHDLFPASGLTGKLYAWYVGSYVMAPNQEGDWFDADYNDHPFAETSTTSVIVAKLKTSASLTVTKSGAKRTITVKGSRDSQYEVVKASGKATILRNGKAWKRVTLKKGKATATGRGKARWSVSLPETGSNWDAVSRTVTR